ncbi:MAG TPA: multidrug effflux MFS transporter [Nordella sp.]|nr:multidrug effflux MFS transporter [Nordella sp.]
MPEHPASSAARRPPFLILVAVSAIGPLALNMFMPSMPGLQATFGVSYGTVQLTLTLYLVGLAVCQLFYGPLSDRYGRRPLLLAGLALFVIASIASALATSIETLILARLVQALGGASGIVLSRAIVRDLYHGEKGASVLGYITMAWVLAPMIAPVIGGYLDQIWGFRSSFVLLALIGALTLIIAWFTLHETNFNRRTDGRLWQSAHYGRIFASRQFRGYATTLAFASAVFFTFLAFAPFLTVNIMGRSAVEYGLWFILVSFGYMIGNFLSGRYSVLIGNDRMVLFGNLMTLAGAGLCLLLALLGFLTPLALFAPMLLCALGNGLTIPNGTIRAISVDPLLVGTAAGLLGFVQMGISAVISQGVGALQDQNFMIGYWTLAICAALSMLAHLAMTKRR